MKDHENKHRSIKHPLTIELWYSDFIIILVKDNNFYP